MFWFFLNPEPILLSMELLDEVIGMMFNHKLLKCHYCQSSPTHRTHRAFKEKKTPEQQASKAERPKGFIFGNKTRNENLDVLYTAAGRSSNNPLLLNMNKHQVSG